MAEKNVHGLNRPDQGDKDDYGPELIRNHSHQRTVPPWERHFQK